MIETPIRMLHVVGPLGEQKCPECGSEDVHKCGSWEWGPLYWRCEDCDHEWGHA